LRRVRRLLNSTGPGWIQFALLVALYLVYFSTRLRSTGATADALANARGLVDLQRSLGLLVEPDVQAWVVDSRLWSTLANLLYIVPHFPMVLGLLWWAYRRRPGHYVLLRNTFLFSSLVGFAIFVLYPVAPPVALPELGLVDTLSRYGPLGYGMGADPFRNTLAAVPSLHVVYALLASIGFLRLADSIRWRGVAAAYVPVVIFAIVATGNHFLLDAVAAIPMLALGYWLAGRAAL
jgi:hypothetical protein